MIKIKKILVLEVIFMILLYFIFSLTLANAQSLIPSTDIKIKDTINNPYSVGCIENGDCKLNDFMVIAVGVSQIILGVVGSLALLAFVAGGVMFLISAGNQERVTQAKQIILGAVIGLVIVFTSYMIIQFVFTALGVPGMDLSGWANVGWFGGGD